MGARFYWSSINFNGAVYLGYWPSHEPNPFIYVNGAQFGIVAKNMAGGLSYMDYNFGGVVSLQPY